MADQRLLNCRSACSNDRSIGRGYAKSFASRSAITRTSGRVSEDIWTSWANSFDHRQSMAHKRSKDQANKALEPGSRQRRIIEQALRHTDRHQHRYILFYKPYDVLCQFTDASGRATLKDYVPVPGVYSVGRLDRDSEGLLLLTDDGMLAHRLTDPRFEHPRTYLAQVERIPGRDALAALRGGITLADGPTRPAEACIVDEPLDLPTRPMPIRFRKNVPTAWIRLIIREGRNRQVRRMTAAVGHPTLRLLRIAIGPLTIEGLSPGQWRDLTSDVVTDVARGAQTPIGR
jgi:23S rRNA pseudouridine2457 synthase